MKFLIFRSSQGVVSKTAPCPGAVRGPEAAAWPGEFEWHVELATLEALMEFLQKNGGALGVFAAEEGEECPALEIFDDAEEDDDA